MLNKWLECNGKMKKLVMKYFNPDSSICRTENDFYLVKSTFDYFKVSNLDYQVYQMIKLPN